MFNAEKLGPPIGVYKGNGQDGFYDPDLAHPNTVLTDEFDPVCPPETTDRKLVAKIDFRIIPVLSILYLLAFLDR
jgi:hypothetical protein